MANLSLLNYASTCTEWVKLAESLVDFTSMLVDLFEELSASQDVLSPHLGEQLEALRAILSPC